jgi:hypothetical protein
MGADGCLPSRTPSPPTCTTVEACQTLGDAPYVFAALLHLLPLRALILVKDWVQERLTEECQAFPSPDLG